MKKIITTAGVIGIVAASISAYAYDRAQLAKEAKISIEQAREIALKAFPGKITDEELEKEQGGSGLRYSFDIKQGKTEQEVGVDASTGTVLENVAETDDRKDAHQGKDVEHKDED
ncbi:MAG: peptidase M4 [Gammaproteobacteria bacterium]|nr:peptidase M4 [Gammaproteobacteria bacterium]